MKKMAFLLVCVLLCTTIASVCVAQAEIEGEITIGVMGMMTGTVAQQGVMMVSGMQLAVDDVNAKGGVHGKKVVLRVEDCSNDVDTATNAMNKLISDKDVVAIIGPHLSTQVFAIANIVQEGKKPVLVGGTNPGIPDLQKEISNLFGTRTNDSMVARAAAAFLVDSLNATKVALFNSSDDFGTGGARVAKAYFEEKGIAYQEVVYNPDDTDFTSSIIQVMNNGCDAAFIWSLQEPYIILARQMYELGFTVPTMTNGCLVETVVASLCEIEWIGDWYCASEFVPTNPSDLVQNFIADFRAKYGMDPDLLSACYNGSAYLLMDALSRAEYPFTNEGICEALLATDGFEAPVCTYSARPDENHQLSWGSNIVHRNMEELEFITFISG